jgi:serine/threonine protein kinase
MICPRCNSSNTAAQLFCGQCGAPLSTTSAGYDTKDRLGKVLDGRYHLRSLIGIGSAGAVYKAEQVDLGTSVAVKVLHPHVTADQNARMRLENEASLASRIDHPNIVSILDVHSSPELVYLVMEYLSGVSLDEVLAEVGHLGLRRTIHIIRQLLAALSASHRLGVLHRDLKPDNIYLTARHDRLDFVKVVDFGLATLRHKGNQSRITVEGHVCGTPGYMAPEQARNQELTEQTDLYAVGVILYECLTGSNPFLGESTVDTMVNQITLTPRVPSKVLRSAQIPLYVDALVMRALSKQPNDRFTSAQEFRTVLEGLVLAQKRRADGAERGARTCGECGHTLSEVQTHCDACGEPASGRAVTPTGVSRVLTPEMISAIDSSEVPAAELDLSPTTSIRAYSGVRWDPPYIGRKDELARINAMLETGAAPHQQRLLRIIGGAGLGKGRLAREAARRAGSKAWKVVWVQPELHPAFAALYPIQRAVAKLLKVPAFPPSKQELLETADRRGFNPEHQQGLLELFGLTAPSKDPAKQRRRRRAEALSEAVRCAGDKGPLMLLFQDLHLFDAPSQELVATLASAHKTKNPTSVIVTHDPALMLLWPETEMMTVQALSTDEAKLLAVSLLEHIKLPTDDVEALITASRGSPLMLIELVRLVAIDPSIKPPRSLPEAVNMRINRLPPKMRTMIHTMAVLGRPTNPDTLVTVLEEADLEAEHRGLNFLAEQGFLLSVGSGWHPAHRMHQQVAYSSIPAALRLQLHAKAADMAIEAAEPSATVAYHLYAAGEKEQAVPHLLRAGRRALYFLDDQLAAKLFNRVLQLVPTPPGTFGEERGPWKEATLGLAAAHQDGGDETQARRLLKKAAAQAEKVGWELEQAELERAHATLKAV